MSHKIGLFIGLLAVICISCTYSPGIYLDSRKGDDGNNGDLRHPIRSISRLNDILKEETRDVYLKGGQIFEGTLRVSGKSGLASDSVRICSYGGGRAVINGGNNEAIIADSCRFISVSNLSLKGSGRKTGNTTNGLAFLNSSDCTISDIEAEGFQKSGVEFYNCAKIRILKVKAFNNGFCGIHVIGSERELSRNILIKDCSAENNPGDPARLDNHSGNGILAGVSDSVVIDHCTATNNGWDMPRQGNGPVGIWAWESSHIVIQYCISYRNRTSDGGLDGGGFDFDGGVRNSVIQYCLSYENAGAGFGLFQFGGASPWSANIIRYCVSINDAATTRGAGSFFIWNGSGDDNQLSDCYVYNNLVYNVRAPVISFEGDSRHRNFSFSNNIFIGGGEFIGGINQGSRFLGNSWWSAGSEIKFQGYKSLAQWADATGQEKENGKISGIEADPLLTGLMATGLTDPYKLNTLTFFKPQPGSPLKGRGVKISSRYGIDPPDSDFFGNPLPADSVTVPGICVDW